MIRPGHIRLEEAGGCGKKREERGHLNSSRLCEAHSVLTAGQTFCAVIAAKRSRISSSLRIGHIAKESLLDWDEWDESRGA